MKFEPKWTPGEWELFNKGGIISIYKDGKEVIKWTGFDSSDYPEDVLANARLISQAPALARKLYETVEFLTEEIDSDYLIKGITQKKRKLRDDLSAFLRGVVEG